MADEIRIEIEALKETGNKYIALLEITSNIIREFNKLDTICDEIANRRYLSTLDYFSGSNRFIKEFKELLQAEYEVFDKGIDEFIKADRDLSTSFTNFIESEVKDNEKYKKRLEGKKYEERANEIEKILEDLLGKYQYIDENGAVVIYNHIEARNLYSKDEFEFHNKVRIRRIEMPDGQYIDNFIDEDTGEIYKRISHVLDGNSQEAIKLGIERDRVYVEYETFSDDTAMEGFKSWGFSIMNCLVQDGYSLGELGCYVLYCNDSQTREEKIQRIELRKQDAEEYYRGQSRSQKLFNDMKIGYRVYEVVGMTLSVGEILSNLPKILTKAKNSGIKVLDFIEDCVQNTKTLLKDAKSLEIPSMDDIVGYFYKLTGKNQLEPAIEGIGNSKHLEDINELKKPEVDKIEGDICSNEGNKVTLAREDLGELLGSGGNKDVYAYGEKKAVGVLKDGKPEKLILEELDLLNRLEELELPTVNASSVNVDGKQGLMFDKFAEGSKDIVRLEKGKVRIVGNSSLLNKRSVNDLTMIRNALVNKKIKINDLQFLIGKDGSVVIADPLDVLVGESPSKSNLRMIDLLIESARKNF